MKRSSSSRINSAKKDFINLYDSLPTVIARAPGRAEILGCHTDYNYGFALAAGITRDTLCLASKRDNGTIAAASSLYPNPKPVIWRINEYTRVTSNTWTNYIRAVVHELSSAGYRVGGANLYIESTVPKSGGVSSSAALELAVAFALMKLYNQPIDKTKVALLCKKAENSPTVNSPCGFLDQGASAYAKKDGLVLMDFLPKGDAPVSRIEVIPAKFPVPASFIIPVDPTLERQLGETGYRVRRKMCEDSLHFWQNVLKRKISSLRDVTLKEFLKFRDMLEKKSPEMRKRVEHIITENVRVLDAVTALKHKDITRFGILLTEAGKSSLELYDLDENTPQLTFLVVTGRKLPGVIGMRNMGGGFSAIALALVKNSTLAAFRRTLGSAYKKRFGRTLEFIEFTPSEGAEILYG